ncbi:unnamed protein product, partial [Gongylonema pulchrum]|uniref:Protein transport protein sec16 n=1 Tax=Gongylonema pulchrum TaxID=637853 RepID=A0A183DP03_9BILA
MIATPFSCAAQDSPFMRTCSASTITTSSSATSTPISAPPPANVARVGPISNQHIDTHGISVNRVFPTTQPVVPAAAGAIIQEQIPAPIQPAMPVTSNVADTPILAIAEEIAPRPAPASRILPACPTIPTRNSPEQSSHATITEEQQWLENSAPAPENEARNEPVRISPAATSSSNLREQNRPERDAGKDRREPNVPAPTPVEHQSTDSTTREDSVAERLPQNRKNSKNVRDRYRIIRQQYPEVVKRLDRLKLETRRLDWHSLPRGATIDLGEGYHHPVVHSKAPKYPLPGVIDASGPAGLKESMLDRSLSKLNHSFTVPERMSSEDGSTRGDIHYGEDFINSLRRHQHLSDVFAQSSPEKDFSENDDETSGSDSEIARIHYEQEMTRRAAATATASMRYNAVSATAPNEYYYFGVIQLPQERVQQVMCRMPPPQEYFSLPPIEKAAYLFYCTLYQHHYQPVDLFHKKFNREYFSYMCEGDSAELALWKEFKHCVFSLEPMKFRVAHSFLRFGVGGRVVVLNAQNSENILEIRDLKSLIGEDKLLRLSNAVDSFRGPLIPGRTPTHSVRLYVQRQIELILRSEAYRTNLPSEAANDCLLIWQLLEMLVQQQGRVTGPDLSRLLMTGCHLAEHRRHVKEKFNSSSPIIFSEHSVDSKAYDRFTQFLLGGHLKEALDSAVRDGLYSDAMILARRLCIGDPQELERIETAFLSHRSEQNPVMTLLSVASGQPAPVLVSSIVLANLNTPMALGTVHQLGCVLARREQHAAADFCFLAVSLLAPGYDPFQPIPKKEDESSEVRKHITLIHATLRTIPEMDLECLKDFSVIDLHATEIFEFAMRLANDGMHVNLTRSLAYQLCRLHYAEVIAELGALATDAFQYSVDVARSIWNRCNEVDVDELERLLKFMASANENDLAWLPTLRSILDERRKVPVQESLPVKRDTATPSSPTDEKPALKKQSPEAQTTESHEEFDKKEEVTRTSITLTSEPVEWRIGHKESSSSTSVSVEGKDPESQIINEYRMQPAQLNSRTGTYSSTGVATAHTSQYSTVPPTPSQSMQDATESSSATRTTAISSSSTAVPQSSESISLDNTSLPNSHENDLRSKADRLLEERKMEERNASLGAASAAAPGNYHDEEAFPTEHR